MAKRIEIISKRNSNVQQITRIQQYFNDLQIETADLEDVELRLERLKILFQEFDSLQLKVEHGCTDVERKDENDRRILNEKCYFEASSKATKIIKELKAKNVQVSTDGQSNSEELNNAIQKLIEHQTTLSTLFESSRKPEVVGNLRLPPIEVPVFNGSYTGWLEFHDLFSSLVHTNTKLTKCEKLQYLKKSLVGQAKGILSNLTISEANYDEAYDQLINVYNKTNIIIEAHLETIMEQPKLTTASAEGLRTLCNNINESVRALRALKQPTEHWDAWLVFVLTYKFDSESRKLWRRAVTNTKEYEVLKFSELVTFTNNRVYEITPSTLVNSSNKPIIKDNKQKPRFQGYTHAAIADTSQQSQCLFCKKSDHILYHCKEFAKMSIKSRKLFVKENNICFNCIRSKHMVKDCNSKHVCRICSRKHHTLLHESYEPQHSQSSNQDNQDSEKLTPKNSLNATLYNKSNILTNNNITKNLISILPTAIILVQNVHDQHQQCRALLDTGSQITLTTEGCAQRLGLSRSRTNVDVHGIGSDVPTTTRGQVILNMKSNINNFKINTTAFVLRKLANLIPAVQVKTASKSIFSSITLADPMYFQPGKIDIILSCDVFFQVLLQGKILTGPDSPIALETQFGWLVSGKSQEEQVSTQNSFHVTCEVDTTLKKFWEIEDITYEPKLTEEETMIQQHFKETHSRTSDGRYIVQIPFSQSPTLLGNSRNAADRMLKSMERRLNDISLVGPTIQTDIWSLLLEFRKFKIAYTADIAKMYRQILVHPKDTPYQRILWRKTPQDVIDEYELLTVTYGTASAPYLAVQVLHQLADDESAKFQIGSKLLKIKFYVDDFIQSCTSVEEALTEKQEITEILQMGGFCLRKWSSNNEEFLNTIKPSEREMVPMSIQEDASVKTLGLQWHPKSDYFTYKVSLDNITYFTKRSILSEISWIYDPLGLLAPIIIYAKVILQQLWVTGKDWDIPVPESIHNKYKQFRDNLLSLSDLKIQRWLNIQPDSELELIGFCDASEVAYSAAVYIRVELSNNVKVQLIAAKTKVAPIQQMSLPRLELCGASLLTKLIINLKKALNLQSTTVKCFTDSTIVLAWLQEIPRKWKSFIANRTSFIITNIPVQHWQHVKSGDNPADSASRGILPNQIHNLDLWWHGPKFLYNSTILTTISTTNDYKTQLEKRPTSTFNASIRVEKAEQFTTGFNLFDKFSSLFHLQRVTARILRFISNCKSAVKNHDASLSVTEIQEAMVVLIRCHQNSNDGFPEEINLLTKGKIISKRSKLLTLNPILDNEGILRVGGRIQQSNLSYGLKHPIILCGKSKIAELLIKDIHNRYFHAGQQLMSSIISTNYWLINGKNQIRKCVRNCVVCMRYKTQLYTQQMGQLPAYRVTPSRPFTNTGTDFAGPFYIKPWHGRGAKLLKSYIAIFVCMSTKALHLELVTDLSTDSLMAAIHRFVNRRGVCKNMYSDNGRNYIGAARQLKEMQQFLQQNHLIITSELCKNQIEWHFIPAYAPHFGGIWESAVKSVKYHMKRVIGDTHLTFELMSTLLCQFEACLNSRPLAPKTDDIDDLEPLTPAHFLNHGPILMPAQEEFNEKGTTYRSRWQQIQHLYQSFWKRWYHEYIHSLQQRKKWALRTTNIKINDLVLVKEDNMPPSKWLMGRVVETVKGPDGLIRVVNLKTQSGIIKRAIHKLVVLVPSE